MKRLKLLGSLPASPLSTLPASPSDTDLGVFALSSFWQDAESLNPEIPSDWSEFLDLLRRAYFPKNTDEAPQGYTNWKQVYFPNKSEDAFSAYIDGLGFSLRSVGFDTQPDKIASAMQALASQGGGAIPGNQNTFFSAVQNQAQAFSFFDAAAFVAVESAKQIASGVADVGQDLLDTGSAILKYRNYILIAVSLAGAALLWKKLETMIPHMKLAANPRRRK